MGAEVAVAVYVPEPVAKAAAPHKTGPRSSVAGEKDSTSVPAGGWNLHFVILPGIRKEVLHIIIIIVYIIEST